jgi:glycosyltransferase involved in cell wall biosynthesis
MNNIKVCHLSSVHRALDTRIFLKECRSLKKQYHVNLIAKHSKIEVIDDVRIIPFPNISNRFFRILLSPIIILFLALRNKSNIYHIHDPELLFLVLPLRIFGAKVVYDSHEHLRGILYSKDYLNKVVILLLSFSYFFIERIMLPLFSAIIVATPAILKELKKFNNNIFLINNYPLLKEFDKLGDWNYKTNSICYIGGITRVRGIIQILDSLDELDISFHLAGSYDPPSFRNELIEHRNWDKVIEYGFVDREKMASIMNESLFGMVLFSSLPNHINAQPNKIFEYMSAGIPIIGSNFKLWREIIEENSCGICANPKDEKEIQNVIKYLIEHRSKAEQMGENGRKAVEDKYNWQMEERKLFHLYERLI